MSSCHLKWLSCMSRSLNIDCILPTPLGPIGKVPVPGQNLGLAQNATLWPLKSWRAGTRRYENGRVDSRFSALIR